MNILTELSEFYDELKVYKDLLEMPDNASVENYVFPFPVSLFLGESRPRTKEKMVEELREKLVRKTGALKGKIVELIGKRMGSDPRSGRSFDFWIEAFDVHSWNRGTSLDFCIHDTNEAIGKLESDIEASIRDKNGDLITREIQTNTPPKAFIAHGGESPALDKLKKYLLALGVEPLIVEEQPSRGRSIGENVDYYAGQADFAVILATRGDKDTKSGAFIPRGNVLVEIGKAQELFPDKIIYLLQAGTKFPSNISEKVWIRFTPQSMDDAFIRIAQEMCGLEILKAIKPLKGA